MTKTQDLPDAGRAPIVTNPEAAEKLKRGIKAARRALSPDPAKRPAPPKD